MFTTEVDAGIECARGSGLLQYEYCCVFVRRRRRHRRRSTERRQIHRKCYFEILIARVTATNWQSCTYLEIGI